MSDRVYNVLHLFAGIGGGSLGFMNGRAEYNGVRGSFRTIGAIDSSEAACRDYEIITGNQASCLDLFDREAYKLYHGEDPPEGWREVGVTDMLAVTKGERPDVIFTSPPCKGFSGLISGSNAALPKYAALNSLVVRGVFLTLSTWADNPPGLFILENVPRIKSRGVDLLAQLVKTLEAFGYLCSMSDHDCGELGGLGQSRKRFLLVARHAATVPAVLYQPHKQKLKSIEQVVGELPLPGDPESPEMHILPKLTRPTWEKLAMVRPGKDWKDLARWEEGRFWLRHEYGDVWRLVEGSKPAGVEVCRPTSGNWNQGVYGVRDMSESCGAVAGRSGPSNGAFSIADPRMTCKVQGMPLRVKPFSGPSPAVIATSTVWSSGSFSVADTRLDRKKAHNNVYRVQEFDGPSCTVTSGGTPTSGGLAVADTRLGCSPRNGVFGVMEWERHSCTVTASIDVHAGTAAIADPRELYGATKMPRIISTSGCWHRPLTPQELFALQSFSHFLPVDTRLSGKVTSWRTGIGNAVPPLAAKAIAEQMLKTLLVSDANGFRLSDGGGFWVRGSSRQFKQLETLTF